MKKKAIFLDRDGTINPDPGYIDSPEKFRIYPAARIGLKLLYQNNYLLFVVSNQSGLGRGYFPEESLKAIHEKLEDELLESGVRLAEIVYCPHHPEDGCHCRKPSPYLVMELAERYKIDLAGSYFIGDKVSDVVTGINSGCSSVLLASPEQLPGLKEMKDWADPDYIAKDLHQAARWITEARRI